jgi:apolipoprotein N-acyltransferase
VQTNLRTTRGGNVADATELAILRQLNDEARGSKPALIVWPEGAAPGEGISDPGIADSLGELARSSGAYHLFGTAHRSDAGGAHNSAALFGPDGSLLARYDKQWLVPYGEWVPGRSWLPLLEALHAPGSDLEPGIDPRPVTKGPFSLGVMICFESVFPSISREQTRRGANLLALVTNDSWSGTQDVLWQHAAMTAFRAVENRRWVVMSATTGITGVVVSDGSVRTVPPAERGVLHAEAQLRGGLTPYTRFGDWFVACCAVLALAVIARRSATIFDTPRSPVV